MDATRVRMRTMDRMRTEDEMKMRVEDEMRMKDEMRMIRRGSTSFIAGVGVGARGPHFSLVATSPIGNKRNKRLIIVISYSFN